MSIYVATVGQGIGAVTAPIELLKSYLLHVGASAISSVILIPEANLAHADSTMQREIALGYKTETMSYKRLLK
jgi:hypothetical protein